MRQKAGKSMKRGMISLKNPLNPEQLYSCHEDMTGKRGESVTRCTVY